MSQQPKSWAQQRIQQLCEKREQILEHIEKVKMQMKQYADERRRTTSALLKVGAWAYVQMPRKQVRNYALQTSAKLSVTRFGPFKVVEQVSSHAFRLDLGKAVSGRTIDVFHVKYLRPAVEGPYETTCKLEPAPVLVRDSVPEYELERIIDKRTVQGKSEYLVQYKGLTSLHDCEWQPLEDLAVSAPELLAEFERSQQRSLRGPGKRKR